MFSPFSSLLAVASGAFLLGIVSNLHCAAMCGPIACAVGATPLVQLGRRAPPLHASPGMLYAMSRWGAYTLWGALLGGLSPVLGWLLSPRLGLAFSLVLAVGLGARSLLGARSSSSPSRSLLASWVSRVPGGLRPALVGAATPLLPCGVSFWVAASAVLTHSALEGAVMASAFAMASTPGVMLGAVGVQWLSARLSPARAKGVQRGLTALAIALLVFRAAKAQVSPARCCPEGAPLSSSAP